MRRIVLEPTDPFEEKRKREEERRKLIEGVRRLYEDETLNLTIPQIARVLQTSYISVRDIIVKEIGASRAQKQKQENKIRDEKIIECVKEHPRESIVTIAKKLDLSEFIIRHVLRRNEIKKPNPQTLLVHDKIPLIKTMLLDGKTDIDIKEKTHVGGRLITILRKELGTETTRSKNSHHKQIWLKIQRNKNKTFTVCDFKNCSVTRQVLSNLCLDKKIIRVSRGHYKLNPKWRENK